MLVSSAIGKNKVRARQMAQQVKGLLCKQEDLSSNPEHTHKKQGMAMTVAAALGVMEGWK